MESTADVAATSITLSEAVDWVAGDVIVIASSDYEARHAEKRTITAVDNTTPSNPVVSFADALLYKHYVAIDTYGAETIDMRTEVGLFILLFALKPTDKL